MTEYIDQSDVDSTLRQAGNDGVRFVNLQFTDIQGHVKSVTLPIGQLEDSLRFGTWFDGSSIQGFARIAESDMFLVPDPATYALVPWEGRDGAVARMICYEYEPDGTPLDTSPRWALRRAMDIAKELGFEFNTGPELEFFLFKRDGEKISPEPHDEGGYFDYSTDAATAVRNDMIDALQAFGITVETSHHEVALGQHEIDFQYSDALTTADNAVTFKYALKAIAQQHDLHATFMPKPLFGINGSGMHTHQSLFSEEGINAFHDADDPVGISSIARHFIAGQLIHARAMCCVLSPLVNSYKRLVPGYEAPVYISWGQRNRSALIRIPRINPAKPQATRIELRCPDGSTNPYLAFAVMLRAGLDGIATEAQLPEEVGESLYEIGPEARAAAGIDSLPGSLDEAIEETEKSDLIKDTLGPALFEPFIDSRKQEWADYKQHVSTWELDRYLATY